MFDSISNFQRVGRVKRVLPLSLAALFFVMAPCIWVIPEACAQSMDLGPQPPAPKPESPMTQTLKRLLHKKEGEQNTPADDSVNPDNATEDAAEEDGGNDKPDKDEKPFYPSNGPGPSNQHAPASKKAKKPPKRSSDSADSSTKIPGVPDSKSEAQQTKPLHPPLLTQPALTNVKVDVPEMDQANPPVGLAHPRLNDPTNPLGFTSLENRLKKYTGLVDAHRYADAKPGLVMTRQWLVDLTEAHIGLYKTLNQLPTARGQAELEKELALQYAQLRDRSMVEMARIYMAEKDYFKAVKELSEVVKSQPRTTLGVRAYSLLQEMGFTEKLQLAH